jgi:hypothetical protein
MKAKTYPDWVEKHHTKGTSVKQIRDSYYLYSVTSHYSKEKGYPVSEQRYIGKITEDGLIEPDKVSFIPGVDRLVLFRDIFDLSTFSESEKQMLNEIPLLKIGSCVYTGHLNRKQISVLKLYFNYDNGVIRL